MKLIHIIGIAALMVGLSVASFGETQLSQIAEQQLTTSNGSVMQAGWHHRHHRHHPRRHPRVSQRNG